MRQQTVFILSLILLCSCATGLRVRKNNFIPIDGKFKGTFKNEAYLKKGKNPASSTILELFDIYLTKADTVHIYFDDKERLVVTFQGRLGNRFEIFDGRFRKRGFYEVFLRNKKIEIPPYFSIIYSSRDIDRIRIGLTKDNNLIIDNKWARDGNFFLFAAGGSGRFRCFFKSSNSTD